MRIKNNMTRPEAIRRDTDVTGRELMIVSSYRINYPVTAPDEMPEPIGLDVKPDPERMYIGAGSADPALRILADRLLSFGGTGVCLPGEEEDYDDIMTLGQLWYGKSVKMMKGRPNKCHANSAELFRNNRNALLESKLAICTGYALSEDGLWRQHSWLAWIRQRSVTLVETTVPRIAYFGFCMPLRQSERFADANL